jgi:hypothetical protein
MHRAAMYLQYWGGRGPSSDFEVDVTQDSIFVRTIAVASGALCFCTLFGSVALNSQGAHCFANTLIPTRRACNYFNISLALVRP